ncbi:alpha/beta-type small acid-soluble spore protein [Neobacillus vireti]|uniref:alpha/beta-type small acid-soluble spore protein n=1 Tax=Neobacillus vireti TaxID=220686 RepID=UPI002FFD9356
MTNLTIEQVLEQLRNETAAEMGIELGANTSSRLNGSVGARMTQKLVELGKQQLLEISQEQSINPAILAQYNNQSTPQHDLLH